MSMKQRESLTLQISRGWKFCFGDVKRWNYVDHGVCYNATKAGHEVGEMDVFLKENEWLDAAMYLYAAGVRRLCCRMRAEGSGFGSAPMAWRR